MFFLIEPFSYWYQTCVFPKQWAVKCNEKKQRVSMLIKLTQGGKEKKIEMRTNFFCAKKLPNRH